MNIQGLRNQPGRSVKRALLAFWGIAIAAAAVLAMMLASDSEPASATGENFIAVVDSNSPTGSEIGFTSLALDDDEGFPVVSYYNDTFKDLMVLRCNDVNCDPAVSGSEAPNRIITSDQDGRHGSLVLSGVDDHPVVSFYNDTDTSLDILRCDDPSCAPGGDTTITKDSSGDVGQHTSAAMHTNGDLTVSYWHVDDRDLKILHCHETLTTDPACAPGGDAARVIDGATEDVGQYTSLALDSTGDPVISYFEAGTANNMRVVRCDDPSCEPGGNSIEIVQTSPGSGLWTSVALDTAAILS